MKSPPIDFQDVPYLLEYNKVNDLISWAKDAQYQIKALRAKVGEEMIPNDKDIRIIKELTLPTEAIEDHSKYRTQLTVRRIPYGITVHLKGFPSECVLYPGQTLLLDDGSEHLTIVEMKR